MDHRSYPSPNANSGSDVVSQPFYNPPGQQSAVPNPNELQLTAQLTRGLASSAMSQGPVAHMVDNHALASGQTLGQPTHQYAQEQTPQPSMRNIGQTSQSPLDQMDSPFETPDGGMAPRKRSKASRACDECRRKKIKCDATSETGDIQCSNCRRVSAHCQFSRVPMKRGPSKGYIKELADRVNTLERVSRIDGHIDGMGPEYGGESRPEDFPPSMSEDNMRKRSFGSAGLGSPYQPGKANIPWTQQDRHQSLSQQTHPNSSQQHLTFRDPIYTPNGFPSGPQWKTSSSDASRLQSSAFENIGLSNLPSRQSQHDTTVVSEYYKYIHPTYPILPHDPKNLDAMINSFTVAAQEAFFECLYAVIRCMPDTSVPVDAPSTTGKAAQLLLASQINGVANPVWSTDGLNLISMMLLAIEAEISAPITSNGHVTRSKSLWLSTAVDLAKAMELHSKIAIMNDNSPDSEYGLGRRAWLSLVVMDVWNSASTSAPRMIPDEAIIIQPHDVEAMLEEPYHVARLSIVLGHATTMRQQQGTQPLCFPSEKLFKSILDGERERVRESIPKTFYDASHAAIFRATYHYIGITNEIATTDSNPYQLLNMSSNLVEYLVQFPKLHSLLLHHAIMLAALSLLELRQISYTGQAAEQQLSLLLQTPFSSNWDHLIKSYIRKNMQQTPMALPLTETELKASAEAGSGLQRLADVATASDGVDAAKIDLPLFARYHKLRAIVNGGYMKVFDGDAVR